MTKHEIEVAKAKIFTHGGSQAVRLPKAFRFAGGEVTIRRDGDAVILEPIAAKPRPTSADLDAMWARIDALVGGEFPDREQPRPQGRNFDW